MPRAVRLQILELVRGAPLHAHAVPLLERVLQARVAIDDQQQRRRQPALLEIGDDAAPDRRGLRGGDAQA